MKLLLAFAISTALFGQTVNMGSSACQSTHGNVKVLLFMSTAIGSMTATVPICVSLGTGFSINTASLNGPTLEFSPPVIPAPATPRQVVDRVVFAATIPATQTTLGWTLAHTPAPGTMIIAVLRSSMIGANTVDIVDFNVTTPKAVTITLPTYRPFPDDGVLLQYWTLEP